MDTRIVQLGSLQQETAEADAAMINGHPHTVAVPTVSTATAEADAAMINGHPEEIMGCRLDDRYRGGRRGDDQWTLERIFLWIDSSATPRRPTRR